MAPRCRLSMLRRSVSSDVCSSDLCEKQAPETSPTYPVPIMAMRIMELSQYHPYGGHPDGSTRSDRISHLCFRVSVHDLLNFPPKIVARQCESDVRFEKADLVAAVEPSSFEAQPVDRKRYGEGKGVPVRLDHGGRRIINKKKK